MNHKDFKQLTVTIVILMLGCFFIGSLSGYDPYPRRLEACSYMCKQKVASYNVKTDQCTCGEAK